jgi:peptide/nickel transport system substrate-binding protein
MKVGHIYQSRSVRILVAFLAILATVGAGTARAASEPGTVTIVLAAEPMNLDPHNSTMSHVFAVVHKNVVEALTELNVSDGTVGPALAQSWKQIDPKTWQFSLRKGIKFHDGTEFNAEVVAFNVKRFYDKRMMSRNRDKLFGNVKVEARALDSQTVEIKTEKVEPLLPTLMAVLTICSPNTPVGQAIRNPVGTGPYKFVKWDSGVQIVTERFDGYWGKQPQVKKAAYVWRNESSVRAAMVAIGEADLAPEIAVQDAKRPDLDYSYLNSETTQLRIGGAWEPPLNDKRVRMALCYALDRNAIRGSVLSKDVVPATQMVLPNIFGYNPDLKLWPYDPQKARQLLDEARKDGVPVDREIPLVGRIGMYPGVDEVLEVVMNMYKAVGLNVKLRMLEVSIQKPYENKPFPPGPYIVQKMHDNNRGDAQFSVYYQYHCKGTSSPVCDKALDDLIEKAEVATGEARKSLWRSAFKRIHEEVISEVMMFHMVGYSRVGNRINYKPSVATTSEIPLSEISFK